MDFFQILLAISTFLCSLVAGFLFAFAVVVMPGIRNLGDREFILTFQVIDRIIQNNQPIFLIVWVGSVVLLIATLVIGFVQLEGTCLMLLILVTVTYIFGVQLPTVIFNIPLNNKVQTLDVDEIGEDTLKFAREEFESPWNRWNLVRTVISSLVSIMLITLLVLI